MIIRSQDKKNIVNFKNIETISAYSKREHGIIKENYETDIVYYGTDSNSEGTLGTYSTEEKAINVLEMIQNTYANSCKVAISSDGQMQHMVIPVVFQMPQDSEV